MTATHGHRSTGRYSDPYSERPTDAESREQRVEGREQRVEVLKTLPTLTSLPLISSDPVPKPRRVSYRARKFGFGAAP